MTQVATLQTNMKMDATDFNKNMEKATKITKELGLLMESMADNTRTLGTEIKKMIKEVKTGNTQLNRFGQSIENLNTKSNQLRTTTRNIAQNFEQLGRSSQAVSTDMTNIGRQMNVVNTNARRLRTTVSQTGSAFNQLASDANNANNAINSVSNSANQATNDLSGMAEGLATAISAPMAGIGIGAGKMASDIESSTARVNASLGKTEAQSDKTMKSVKGVYTSGWGDSLDEVAQATARVSQAMKSISPKELEEVTKKALMLSKVMEEDVSIVAKSANQLMEQFGLTSTEAFDMMTAGFQQSLNYSDDYLDTLNEYAPYFAKLGFDAKGMFDILISGSENGAFMLDKVGDAFKEFGIRSKDASDLSMQAFRDLGFEDAQKMTDMFAQGGEKAQQAYALVVDALLDMENATKKNEIGVALFGTQFEDLEDKTINAMLNSTNSLKEFGGSAEEAMKQFEESFGQKLVGSIRKVGMALEPLGKILLQMATVMLPPIVIAIETLSSAFEALPKPIQQTIVVLGGIAMAVAPIILLATALKGTAIASTIATVATTAYTTALAGQTATILVATTSAGRLGQVLGTLASVQGWSMLFGGGAVGNVGKLKVAMAGLMTTISTGIKAIGASLMTFIMSPIGAILAVIGLIIVALVGYKKKQEEIAEYEERSKDTWEEIRKLRSGAYSNDESYLSGLDEENEKLEELMNKLKEWNETLTPKQQKGGWINPWSKEMKAYNQIEKEAHSLGYNMDQLTDKYSANTQAIKLATQAKEREQATMSGLNDAKKEEWQNLKDAIGSQATYTDTLKEQIDSYIALSEVEEKSAEEKIIMAENQQYLQAMLGDSVTEYDKNGKAIGLYINKLKDAKQEVVNFVKDSKGALADFTKTNVSSLNQQIKMLDETIALETKFNGQQRGTTDALWGAKDPYAQSISDYNSQKSKENLANLEKERKRLESEREALKSDLTNLTKPSTYTPSSSESSSSKKTANDVLAERIQLELDAYNYQKDMGRLSVSTELDRLQKILKMTKAGTKERQQLDVMVYEKKKEVMERSYADEMALIDFNNSMGKYSTEQYLKKVQELYRKHNTFLKTNVDEQRSMQIKMYDLNLELQNKQLEKFKKNLEKANDVEQEQLRSRKEYLDEAHSQAVERIEEERDAKIKAYQDQIDAINKANDKEERDREVANAKRMLAQYEDSLTQSGQNRANELRKIIRDASATEAQEQVDMVIKAEEDRAKEAIDQINAKYEHDSKLIEQQETVLDKVYSQMEERAETYSAKYTELYGKSQASIQKMLEEGITTEMKTKVDTTTKGFIEVNNAFKAGIDSMVASAKQAFQNVNLGGVNLNPAQAVTGGVGQVNINFFGGIVVNDQADADYFSKQIANEIRNIR